MPTLTETLSPSPTPYAQLPIQKTHKETYASISPSLPTLSQSGKTILITGGGTGVGYAIANGFAQAGASTIILTARRESVLQDAAQRLKDANKAQNPGLVVYTHGVDVSDVKSVEELWKWITDEKFIIDVLISNAGIGQPEPKSMLEYGLDKVWDMFEINVRSHLVHAVYLEKQERSVEKGPAVLINVTSAASWAFHLTSGIPVYSMTKNVSNMLIQQLALHCSPDKLRVVSLHPGLIRSTPNEAFFKKLLPEGVDPPYDSPDLPAHFAVWLASDEAAFLHGRYVQADWDVEELKTGEVRERIDSDPWYLKVGIQGLHP